ncbi:meckelin-like [Watersipora subatra]|uniref:meckelin-like n=1 Tax=Watersipora subatra TaxID=2589382 RepID=UPI00355BA830
MRCRPCTDQQSTTVDRTGFNCVCKDGFKTVSDFGGDSADCRACDPGEAVSSDGKECLTCSTGDRAGTGISADGLCSVCLNSNYTINVEKNTNGAYLQVAQCVTCSDSYLANSITNECERCSTILDTSDSGTCNCTAPALRRVGAYCFNIVDLPNIGNREYFLKLPNGEDSINSEYLVSHLEAAYTLCKYMSNQTSCQLLANLCTANSLNENSWSCRLYREDPVTRQASLNLVNWPDGLPWLFYANSETVLDVTSISTKFSLDKDSPDNTIKLYVAIYTINGTYLGIQNVRNGRIQLCPNTYEKLNAAWSFGTAYEQSCTLYTDDLLKLETLFFDPYLLYEGNLYPIPVLITNYQDLNDASVNKGDNQASWQFTRRFFLVENVLLAGSILTYLSDMSLFVRLVDNGDGSIYPPYLKITYSFERVEDLNENSTVSSAFAVNYELNSAKFDEDFKIAIGVLGGLAFLYGLIETYTWTKRSGPTGFPLVIMKFMAFMTGTLSNAFLIVLVSISVWWLVTFKRQDYVYLLPITESQETFFKNFVIIAFVLKLFDFLHLFVQQVPIDIFLIDWERPKTSAKESQAGSDQGENDSESSVSIWRTYFVANEWNEIQTTRKISGLVQIIGTILFLNVVGFENLCTKDRKSSFQPDSNSYISPHSPMFRFGVMSAIWLVIAVIQWLGFTLIWERFVEDKVRQFVDLCSMANISVFIMENGLFGYYIHGRSPHGIADTGMKEMFRQLKRETENLCAHRGLVPNTDAQTFRMALPIVLRYKYDEVFRQLNQKAIQHTRTQGEITDKQNSDITANANINKFLSNFLDHSLRDIDYTVKDKIFFESLLDTEFDTVVESGIFYNDNGHSFDQVLFYGHELTLTTFEVLLFGLVDMTSGGGFIFSAVIVYVVSLFFQLLRDGLGRRNLAQKTLVDERFLI